MGTDEKIIYAPSQPLPLKITFDVDVSQDFVYEVERRLAEGKMRIEVLWGLKIARKEQ